MFRGSLFRALRALALTMTAVAALFGIPIIIDPPPRQRIADVRPSDGRPDGKRPKAR